MRFIKEGDRRLVREPACGTPLASRPCVNDRTLLHQPTVVTRNRKPLQPNPLARFELRIAERLYYGADEERRVVEIRAVGIKDRDRVFIGGEEIDLS